MISEEWYAVKIILKSAYLYLWSYDMPLFVHLAQFDDLTQFDDLRFSRPRWAYPVDPTMFVFFFVYQQHR